MPWLILEHFRLYFIEKLLFVWVELLGVRG